MNAWLKISARVGEKSIKIFRPRRYSCFHKRHFVKLQNKLQIIRIESRLARGVERLRIKIAIIVQNCHKLESIFCSLKENILHVSLIRALLWRSCAAHYLENFSFSQKNNAFVNSSVSFVSVHIYVNFWRTYVLASVFASWTFGRPPPRLTVDNFYKYNFI